MTTTDTTAGILQAPLSISDKIRALDAEGHSRADIARLLGKRYQHVRNVLEDDKTRRPPQPPAPADAPTSAQAPGVAEGPFEPASAIVRLQLAEDGTVRLPAPVLAALGLKPGAIIIAEVEDDRLILLTPRAAIAKAQALARDLAPPDILLSEELIADRRREAESERDAG